MKKYLKKVLSSHFDVGEFNIQDHFQHKSSDVDNIDSCEVVSDEESESEYGLKHKQKYMCLSNSSLNDSVSSALSSSNLTVRIF